MFGAPRGGSCLAVDVGVVQEVHAVDDDALFGGGLALQHLASFNDAGCFWIDVVAGAGRARSSRRAKRRDADNPGRAAAETRSGSTCPSGSGLTLTA